MAFLLEYCTHTIAFSKLSVWKYVIPRQVLAAIPLSVLFRVTEVTPIPETQLRAHVIELDCQSCSARTKYILAGTKIALRSRICLCVCVCVRPHLSRVLSYVISLLCRYSHERCGSYWKFAG